MKSEIPKIVEAMKNEQLEREDNDNNVNKTVSDEFSRYVKYFKLKIIHVNIK